MQVWMHIFIFCYVNIDLRPLPCLHNPPPLLFLHPHPLRGVYSPPTTPGLFLWFRKWLTCHRKQMGVWAWQIASSPHPHPQPLALGGGVFSSPHWF